jgi:hypothetical protein
MNINEYVEQLRVIANQREAESAQSIELFQSRILGMMRDYEITMGEALCWDYEGFENDIATQLADKTLEADFDFYLWQNNVYATRLGSLATEVFFGRQQDLIVRPYKGTSPEKMDK